MATAIVRHALFDPHTLYARMRSEFDPADKLLGYFLSSAIVDSWNGRKTSQTHLVRTADSNKRQARESSFMPIPKAPPTLTPLALAADSMLFLPGIDIVYASHRVADGQLHVDSRCSEGAGRDCRVFILSKDARTSMRNVTGLREEVDRKTELTAFLEDEAIRSNHDLARLLAAMPDLDGQTDASGACFLTAALPEEFHGLDPDDWFIAAVDASGAETRSSSV
jgi:hypothetical protein